METNKHLKDALAKLQALTKRAEDYDVENDPAPAVKQAPAESTEQKVNTQPGETPVPEQTKFLSSEIEGMLSQQIGNEMSAFYDYTAIKAWFAGQGLDGFAAWAAKQACDETAHMNKVLMFLVECGYTPSCPAVAAPKPSFDSVQSAVEAIFKREKDVTANWRAIGNQAMKDADIATMQLAGCFVMEQIEEEDTVKAIHQKLQKAEGPGLLVIDAELLKKYGG